MCLGSIVVLYYHCECSHRFWFAVAWNSENLVLLRKTLIAFVFRLPLSGLWQGKDATAVVLAINVPFFAKLNGAQITVALFEVGCEIFDIVFCRNLAAYLVDKGRVFVRRYGERGCKKVELVFVRGKILSRLFKTQSKTYRTSFAAFHVLLMPRDKGNILAFVLLGGDEFYAVKMLNHGFKCRFSLDKLVFWHNVGVVIEHCYIKMRGEIFKHTCGAWTATRMQKQTRLLLVDRCLHGVFDCSGQNLFHAIIIYPILRFYKRI